MVWRGVVEPRRAHFCPRARGAVDLPRLRRVETREKPSEESFRMARSLRDVYHTQAMGISRNSKQVFYFAPPASLPPFFFFFFFFPFLGFWETKV